MIGSFFVDLQNARPISVRPLQPPSWELPFGSDKQGRNLSPVMVSGTPLTLRIGLIAGFLGVGFGGFLAFVSAYYGGWVDALIRGIVDVGLTVPGLMVLIVVAMMVPGGLSVDQMALVVASLAWLYPARTIRSQVLTLRERSYVQVARLSGMPGRMIILQGDSAQSAALSGGVAGWLDFGGSAGLDWSGSARFGANGCSDHRHDALLDQLQRRGDQRLVVVVAAADCRDRAALYQPLSDQRGA